MDSSRLGTTPFHVPVGPGIHHVVQHSRNGVSQACPPLIELLSPIRRIDLFIPATIEDAFPALPFALASTRLALITYHSFLFTLLPPRLMSSVQPLSTLCVCVHHQAHNF
jgi:hypothetical protein